MKIVPNGTIGFWIRITVAKKKRLFENMNYCNPSFILIVELDL